MPHYPQNFKAEEFVAKYSNASSFIERLSHMSNAELKATHDMCCEMQLANQGSEIEEYFMQQCFMIHIFLEYYRFNDEEDPLETTIQFLS